MVYNQGNHLNSFAKARFLDDVDEILNYSIEISLYPSYNLFFGVMCYFSDIL